MLRIPKPDEDFAQWLKSNDLPASDDFQDSTLITYMSCALKGSITGKSLFLNSLCNMKKRNIACNKVIPVLGKLSQVYGTGAAISVAAKMYILDLMLKNYLESTVLLRVVESSELKNQMWECKKQVYCLCQQYANGLAFNGFIPGDKIDIELVNNFFNIRFAEGRVSGIWKSFSDIANVTKMAELLESIDVAEYDTLKRSDVAKYILEITDTLDLSLSGHRPLAQKRILPRLKHMIEYDGNIEMVDLTL